MRVYVPFVLHGGLKIAGDHLSSTPEIAQKSVEQQVRNINGVVPVVWRDNRLFSAVYRDIMLGYIEAYDVEE